MSAVLKMLTVASGDRSNNAAFTRWVGNKIGERAGTIVFFAMTTASLGYLKANGASVSRTIYATLFTAISTPFGAGDGSAILNLLDVRGEFIHGWDDSRGVMGEVCSVATRPVRTFYSATASTASDRSPQKVPSHPRQLRLSHTL